MTQDDGNGGFSRERPPTRTVGRFGAGAAALLAAVSAGSVAAMLLGRALGMEVPSRTLLIFASTFCYPLYYAACLLLGLSVLIAPARTGCETSGDEGLHSEGVS